MSWEIIVGLTILFLIIRLYGFSKYIKRSLVPYEIRITSNEKQGDHFELSFVAVFGKGYFRREYTHVIGNLSSENQFTKEMLKGMLALTRIEPLLKPDKSNIIDHEILYHYKYFHSLQKADSKNDKGEYIVRYRIFDPNSDVFKAVGNKSMQKTDEDYYRNGVSKFDLQDYRGAIADFTKAIEINPNHVVAYSDRGAARMNLNDYQGANADYTEAIKIDPSHANAYSNRGLLRIERKDYKGAISDITKAIEINPKDADGYHDRGVAKTNINDHQGAIVDFTKVIELSPNDADGYFKRGYSKARLEDYQGAKDDCAKAIKINPNHTDALKFMNALKEMP